MLPEWVESVPALLAWLEDVGAESGGELIQPDHIGIYKAGIREGPDLGDVEVLYIDDHRVRFATGVLIFGMVIEATIAHEYLEVLEYNFHYQDEQGVLVWRYDKHSGHEDVAGGVCHVHLGDDDNIKPSPEVNMDDVVAIIRDGVWPDR